MKVKYLIIDVDGTMTDGGIYYDENGNEIKKFCTFDAAGFFVARAVGIKLVVLTGRECAATKRRMTELHVDFLYQNIKEKREFLVQFMQENNISKDEVGYIGDDVNDLAGMKMSGYVGCPSNACEEVKEIADYVSSVEGGKGAVRDIVKNIVGDACWREYINKIYGIGI